MLLEFNIPKESSACLAELCTFGKTRKIKSYVSLGYDEVKKIFELDVNSIEI